MTRLEVINKKQTISLGIYPKENNNDKSHRTLEMCSATKGVMNIPESVRFASTQIKRDFQQLCVFSDNRMIRHK